MLLAIHHREGSFSTMWIEYCKKNNIPFKIVDCYSSDIIEQLQGCNGLMWHHHHGKPKDVLFAKQLTFSLESAGVKVFPDANTAWHFDDKIGQKYLMEALGIPLVPTHVFYDKKSAKAWADNSDYPLVFKLRGGASSANVKLMRSKSQAYYYINKAFGSGFTQFDGKNYFFDKIKKYQKGIVGFKSVVNGFGRLFISTEFAKMRGREKGYVYFQKFLPNNDHDIRIIVIDEKAFAIKRMVRNNDFRASGSGDILYARENFDEKTMKLAFEVTEKLKSKCCALDFVYDAHGKPMVVEVSYSFSHRVYEPCVGYWTRNLDFIEGTINPYGWMVDSILKDLKN